MIDVILLVIFLFGCLAGLKRGFILQFVRMAGFIVAFIIAYANYEMLAPKLEMWIPYPNIGNDDTTHLLFQTTHLDVAYYRAIAFIIIFFVTKIVLQIIGSMLDFLARLPLIGGINRIGGAVLGFLESYLIVVILLFVGALVPVHSIQTQIQQSGIASLIIQHTPIFSSMLKSMWFV